MVALTRKGKQMNIAEIIKAIKNGQHHDKYDEWKRHYLSDVREELAKHGYFHDELIFDDAKSVRDMVLKTNPDAIIHILNHPEYEYFLLNYFEDQTYPDTRYLAEFLKNFAANDAYYPTLKIKLASLTTETTIFESTMTAKQLYYAQSPLWAKTLSPTEIGYIHLAQQNIDRLQLEQNELDPMLDAIDTNPKNIWPLYSKFMYQWRKP